MSVLPIVEGVTVVDTPEAFNIDRDAVLIRNLERGQLADTGDANITYDLRVGEKYRMMGEDAVQHLAPEGAFKLYPGQAVLIETAEDLTLPRSRFGCIVSKVSRVMEGVFNSASKVDPGYAGPLVITMFNGSRRVVMVRRGEHFCSIMFLKVEGDVRPYTRKHKSVGPGARSGVWQRTLEWIEGHSALFHLVESLITLVLVGATIWLTIVTYLDVGVRHHALTTHLQEGKSEQSDKMRLHAPALPGGASIP